jgi:ubiquinone/menaquinone biosynthesis C-methylase UbiE
MKDFWKKQSEKKISPVSMGNLEENKKLLKKKIILEKKKVNLFLDKFNKKSILDLGCGTGTWTYFFSKFRDVKKIYAVDYSNDMLNIARKYIKDKNKIKFVNKSAELFNIKKKFNLIWVSGLLIYLNNKQIKKMLNHCKKMLENDGYILIRDATAKKKKFVLKNKYSVELKNKYSAIYRTKNNYKKLFSKNFKLIKDENMFPKKSTLNKRRETILRIYKLQHREQI